jgi:hypothetical protein
VALATIVLSSEVPIEPPTCWPALMVAAATPASYGATPNVPVFAAGAITCPMPSPVTSSGPRTADAYPEWTPIRVSHTMHALLEKDARRLRPAAIGYILLAALQFIALARYPHQFGWGSAAGTAYLIFLATMLLTGTVGLARGLSRAAQPRTLG